MSKTFHRSQRNAHAAAPSGSSRPTAAKTGLATLLAAAALLSVSGALAAPANPPAANALPTGGVVSAGSASLSQAGTSANPVLNVNQASQRAAVNWSTFNVGQSATVNFNQPNAQSVTLNRVLDANPSQIFGRINATGQVYLVNPSGVYFGRGASVDVGGLVATTHAMSDAAFMAGSNTFSRHGATGRVENEGELRAKLDGYIALLAPEVVNNGLIVADRGTAVLASGESIALDFDSQNKLTGIVVAASDIASLIENKQAVETADGQIILSAQSVSALRGSVIKNSGSLVANTGASTITHKGGRILLEGDDVTLSGAARIEAKGEQGGGTVLVGGDWQGGNGVYQATKVTMEAGAIIDASATRNGDGGKVVLWSDIHAVTSLTTAVGSIRAEGGLSGGNGGQIETSGHLLSVDGLTVSTAASRGKTGQWLLDPYDITITGADSNNSNSGGTITGTANSATVSSATIVAALDNSDVTVSTVGAGAQAGNITVSSAIASSSANRLTLNATAGIALNAAITRSGAGGLDLVAGTGGVTGSGAISMSGGGALNFTQGGTSSYAGLISGTNATLTKAGAGALSLTYAGSQTYTGITTVSAGTLKVGHASMGFASSSFLVESGATLDVSSGPGTFSRPITINGAGVGGVGAVYSSSAKTYSGRVTLGSDSSFGINGGLSYITGGISGTAAFSKIGSAALYLAEDNSATLTGAFNINGGMVQLYNFGGLGSGTIGWGGGELNFPLSYNLYTYPDYSSRFSTAPNQQIKISYNSANLVWATPLTSVGGSLTLNCIYAIDARYGSLTLSGANTYTGATTVVKGVLTVTGSLGNQTAVTLSNGAANSRLDVNAAFGVGSLAGDGSIVLNASLTTGGDSTSTTYSGVMSGTGSLTKVGTGTQTLSGASTYAGNTIFSGGVISTGITNSGFSSGIGSGSGLVFDGGTLLVTTGSTNRSLTINSGTTAVINAAVGTTFSGSATTTDGALKKLGAGVLTLSGALDYSGLTTVAAGTLEVTNAAALGAASGSITIESGATLRLTGVSVAKNVTSNGGSIAGGGGLSSTLSGNVLLTANSTLGSTSGGPGTRLTISGVISGGFGLNHTGTGTNHTTVLSGANTYTGATTVSFGRLVVANASGLGDTGAGTTVKGGTTLELQGVDVGAETFNLASGGLCTVEASGGASNISGSVVLSNTPTFNVSGSSLTISGVISQSGGGMSIRKTGSGTLLLSGANNFSGWTYVDAGILKFGSTTALGNSFPMGALIANGAAIDLNGQNYTSTPDIGMTGTGVANSGAIFNSSSTAATYAGKINLSTNAVNTSIVATAGNITLTGTIKNTGAGGAGLTVGGAFNTTLSGVITLSGPSSGTMPLLAKVDAGVLVLSGSNSITGGGPATNIGGGIVKLGNANGLGGAAGNSILILSGAALDLNGLAVNGPSTTGYSTNVAGTGGGSGVIYNSNATASSYNGSMTLTGDALVGGGNRNVSFTSTNATNLGAYELTLAGTSGTNTFAGTFTGSGSLKKIDAGTWSLTSGANSDYSGTTSVNAGTLIVLGGGALGATSTGTTVSSGATLQVDSVVGTGFSSEPLTLAGGTLSVVTPSSTKLTGDIILTADSYVTAALGKSIELSGALSGAFSLTKSGAGTALLSGASVYSGSTTISNGVLQLGSGGALGSTAQVNVASTGTLDINGQDVTAPLVLNGLGYGSLGAIINSAASGSPKTVSSTVTVAANTAVGGAYGIDFTGQVAGGAYQISFVGTDGANASFSFTHGSNTIALIAAGRAGSAFGVANLTLNTTSNLALGSVNGFTGINANGNIILNTAGSLTLGASSQLKTTGVGGSIGVRSARFINNSGAAALSVGSGGNWTAWSTNPDPFGASPDVVGGLAFDYKQYNASGSGIKTDKGTTQRGLVYTYAPVVGGSIAGSLSKEYDGTTNVLGTGLTLANPSGMVNGDIFSGSLGAISGLAFDTKNVGTNKSISGAVTGLDGGFTNGGKPVYGYGFSGSVSAIGQITSKAVTLTAPALVKTYDGTVNYVATAGDLASMSGALVGGDTLSSATVTYANKNAGIGSKVVALDAVSISDGNGGNNYTVTLVGNSSSTINRANLTVAASTDSKTYDGGMMSSLAPTVTGGTLYDTLGGLAQSFSSRHVLGAGLSTINVDTGYTLVDGTRTDMRGNYNVTLVSAVGTIIAKPVTLTAPALTKTYDGSTGYATTAGDLASIGSSLVGSDTVSSATISYANSNAGAANRVVTFDTVTISDGNGGSNYSIVLAGNSNSTITPMVLTVAAVAKSMVYGEATLPNLTYTSTALLNGDGFFGVLATTASAYDGTPGSGSSVGVYPITIGTLNAGSNYTISYASANLTVTPAALNYLAATATSAYGQTPGVNAGSLIGLVNGDTQAGATTGMMVYSTSATSTSGVGSYAVMGSGLTANGNYALVQASGNATALTITPASLTVTADAQSMNYGGNTLPSLTYGSSGLVNGDTFSGTLTTTATAFNGTAGSGSNTGTYPISQGTLTAGANYTITFTGTNLTVSPATLTYVAGAASSAYGQAPSLSAGSLVGLVNGDTQASATTGSLTFSTTATSTSGVGSYPVTLGGLTANANYTLVQAVSNSTALTIMPASLTVTAAAQTMTYGGNALPSLTYSSSGLVNGDGFSGGLSTVATSYDGTAGSGSNVGSYAITQGSLGAGVNYTISFTGASLTVSPATLTYVAGMTTSAYGQTPVIGAGTLIGLVNGDTLSGATTGNMTYATTATSTSGVGSYPISGSGLTANANYTLVQSSGNATSLTITPAALTVLAEAKSMAYGGNTLPALTYTSVGLVNGDSFGGALTTAATAYDGTASSGSDAGVYAISQGTLSAGSNYTISYTGANLTVGKAQLTATGNSPTMTYGANSLPALNVVYTGYVNGDTSVAGLVGSPAVTTSATAYNGTAGSASNVGNYDVATSVAGMSSTNYTFNAVNGTLTVTRAPITVGGLAVSGKTYDGTTTAVIDLSGATYSGLISGDTVSVNVTGADFVSANVGTHAVNLTSTATGAQAGNYVVTAPGSLTGTITLASLSVTADAKSMTYGGNTLPGLTYTYTGFVNNETSALFTGGLTTTATVYNGTAGSGSDAGTYPIAQGTLSAGGNYAITYAGANLTVNKAQLTATGNSPTMTYGANSLPALSAFYSGYVNGDTSVAGLVGAPSLSTAATPYNGTVGSASNVGTYAVTPDVSGLSSTNYTFVSANGTLTVTRAAITVGGLAVSGKTYDRMTTAVIDLSGATYSGLVPGDAVSVNVTGADFISANAGTHAVNLTSTVTGAQAGNYVVTTPGSLTGTITPASLTITADAKSMTYGGNALPALTYVSSGLLGSDALSGALATTATAYDGTAGSGSNAGVYAITQGTLTAGGNYAITYAGANLTVTPATLTYAAGVATIAYGSTPSVSGGTLAGLVNGDTLAGATTGSLNFTTTATAASPVGTYAVTGTGLTPSGNYTLVQAADNGTAITITPASLTVVADAKGMTYGGNALPALTYVATGLVNGDLLSGALTTTASAYDGTPGSGSNAGAYPITQGTLNAGGNYVLAYTGATLTVDKAQLTVSASSPSMTYGAVSLPTLTPAFSGLVNGDSSIAGLTGTLTYTTAATAYNGTAGSASDAGTYAMNTSLAGMSSTNYTFAPLSGALTLTVAPAPLTIQANDQNKNYDGLGHTAGVTYAGFVAGQNVSALAGTLNYAGVSIYDNVSVYAGEVAPGSYDVTPAGLTSANYDISYVTGLLTIDLAPLTVAATSFSKVQDNIAYTGGNGVTYAGFVNGEGVSSLLGTLTYSGTSQNATRAGSFSIVPGGLSSTNYVLTYVNGTLTIRPKAPLNNVAAALTISTAATIPQKTTTSVVTATPVIAPITATASALDLGGFKVVGTTQSGQLEMVYVPNPAQPQLVIPVVQLPLNTGLGAVPDTLVGQLYLNAGLVAPLSPSGAAVGSGAPTTSGATAPGGTAGATTGTTDEQKQNNVRVEQTQITTVLANDAPLPTQLTFNPDNKTFTLAKGADLKLPLQVKIQLRQGGSVVSEKLVMLTNEF
jgi:filamentous hemagglutinin family protein